MQKSNDKKSDKKENKESKNDKENKEEELEENDDENEEKADENPNNINQSKSLKPKKIVYLNQKVILPQNLADRIEYIRNLFYNEEIGYTVNYAPLYQSTTTYEIGKYFKLKQKTILEIASGILFYMFKTFRIFNLITKQNESKNNSSKIE